MTRFFSARTQNGSIRVSKLGFWFQAHTYTFIGYISSKFWSKSWNLNIPCNNVEKYRLRLSFFTCIFFKWSDQGFGFKPVHRLLLALFRQNLSKRLLTFFTRMPKISTVTQLFCVLQTTQLCFRNQGFGFRHVRTLLYAIFLLNLVRNHEI